MIYIDFLDQSFPDLDNLIDWFIQGLVDIEDSRLISSELALFLKECFPDVNLNNLNVVLHIIPCYDAGFIYHDVKLDFNKQEIINHYPEYFI